jgi:basic membrane protein A
MIGHGYRPTTGFFFAVNSSNMMIAAKMILVLMAVAFLTGCGRGAPDTPCFEVAVVTDAGGLGDKGKNDMIWRGCQRFAEESGVDAKISSYEPASEVEGRAYVREASEGGADVVIVASPLWEECVYAVAAKHPDVLYVVVEGEKGAVNVKSLSFPVADAGYLMGVAAAAAVPAGSYAFLGGRKDGSTEELADGYRTGIMSENPSSSVAEVYAGDDFAAPVARGRVRALAGGLFDGGAAVIFAAAGVANADVAAVAKERDKLVIGYESNQNYLEPGYVITSLNIRWDNVVYEELCAAASGGFKGGERAISIASDYICYPIDDNNRSLIPAEAVRKIEAARQRLAVASAG